MNPRTVSARDLETLAHAAHERVDLPGPEGSRATATINGREYRARVAPAAVAERAEES